MDANLHRVRSAVFISHSHREVISNDPNHVFMALAL